MPEMNELAMINPATGEIDTVAPTLTPITSTDDCGFTTQPLMPDQTAILTAPFPDEEWDILPTGEVYVNHMRYRERLTRVFGAGGWGMKPLSDMRFDSDSGVAYQQWALYARGVKISEAVGSARYHEAAERRLDYADTAEAAKSNALTRCCKDLSIGAELYDRRKAHAWKQRYAIKVWISTRDGKNKPQWRRLDADAFYNETGVCNDSPNRPAPAPIATTAASDTSRAATPAREADGPRRSTVRVVLVEAREAKRGTGKNGKPYVIWKLKDRAGVIRDTFSESVYHDACEAVDLSCRVELEVESRIDRNGKAWDFVTKIAPVTDEEDADVV